MTNTFLELNTRYVIFQPTVCDGAKKKKKKLYVQHIRHIVCVCVCVYCIYSIIKRYLTEDFADQKCIEEIRLSV